MTEYDVKALERVFLTQTMPYAQFEMMRDIISRARALLAQRDALIKELETLRALASKNAGAIAADKLKEGQRYRALRRDAEAWRRMFPHGLWINADEASKIVVRYHFRDKDTKEVVVKDNGAPEYSSTAVNPAKPGLQPMKCPCGGKIEFGRERVGYCQKCGASCRVMDPPAPTQPPEGHMVHIPAEYCGKSSLTHAYADGYLAGKGAK